VDDGVGATLREARNRRKIDLSEVEAATKIRVRYLSAIENEEWDLLPADAYARSFVRTYASYLGLDAERLAEQQRRRSGGAVPAERLPRVDPKPITRSRGRRLPSPSPRLLAALVSLALIAVLLVVGLSSGGEDSSEPSSIGRQERPASDHGGNAKPTPAQPAGLSLRLQATAEVWVCLLGNDGAPLVNGQILYEGEEAGPFRSGSFTIAMGNGEIEMTVDGKRAQIPASSSPVGYEIDRGGRLSEIPEGERPTCT
jgi:transcriptional regulator with XRE-family HTH domain